MIILLYLIIFLVVFVFVGAIDLVFSIPVFMLGKKHNVKYAWLVWIPIISSYARRYVLCSVAGDREFRIFDGNFIFEKDKIPALFNEKLVCKNRINSFWIYLAGSVLWSTILNSVITAVSMIPVIGWIIGSLLSLLNLVPAIARVAIDYTYLRDICDIYSTDIKSNNTTAFVIALVDELLPFEILKTVYLFTLLKREPVESALEVEAKPVEE